MYLLRGGLAAVRRGGIAAGGLACSGAACAQEAGWRAGDAERAVEAEIMAREGWRQLPLKFGEGSNFLRSGQDSLEGKKVWYSLFASESGEELEAVVHFGELAEGPPGCAHGGAVAAFADVAMGVCVWESGLACVTANLSVNYRRFVPLHSSLRVTASVDRVEGRKVFTTFEARSLDGAVLHAEGTALFLQMKGMAVEYKAMQAGGKTP